MNVRLAIVVSHPIPYFASWYREIARLGPIDLRVLFCCDWGLNGYRDPRFGREIAWDVPLIDGYAHEFLPIRRRPKRLGFWEVDNPKVTAALARFDPDVVLTHGYARRTVWRAAAWTRDRCRLLMLYSDSSARVRLPAWKHVLKGSVLRRFYDRIDGAMYVSDSNRQYHREYGLPDERLFPGMIPVEVDRLLSTVPDRDQARRRVRQRWGIPLDAFVVVQCGNYGPHKRPLDVLHAVHALRERGRSVWALLVGEGSERSALEAYLKTCGGQGGVVTGFVNQSEIGAYYAAADAVALASSREPLGLAVVEGMGFGLPVIASDRLGCVGPKDAARPDVNAVVFPAGDVAALRDAIECLIVDPEGRRRMAEASARLAQGQTPQVAASALADAVHRLRELGPRSRRPFLARRPGGTV